MEPATALCTERVAHSLDRKTSSFPFICTNSLAVGDKVSERQRQALLAQCSSQHTHQNHNVAPSLYQQKHKWIEILILSKRNVL